MSEITIEVVEDRDHTGGGFAVIRLNGLWLLPANATYRIEPVEHEASREAPPGWPSGDRVPYATRLTPQGVEIIAGPDVVEAPGLLPGTPVAVSVPSAFVRAEVLWPDLPVSEPLPAPPVVLTAAELAAELDAMAEATRKREAAEAEIALEMERAAAESAAAVAAAEARLSLSELRNGQHALVEKDRGDSARPNHPVLVGTPVELASRGSTGALLKPSTGTAVVAETQRPRAIVPARPGGGSTRRRLAIGVPFAVGFAVAALLTAVVALRQGPGRPAPGEAAVAAASLSDVLSVALVSPRGRSAAEIDLQTALKLADESLHLRAGGPDQAEASFWLRKAMSLSIGTPQMSWTLTQLGTLYAQPVSGTADYGKARLLWELAGASGDATALCFLGSLYEHGLGVAKARAQALGYYQRAKAQGGCRDVDQSIARVKD